MNTWGFTYTILSILCVFEIFHNQVFFKNSYQLPCTEHLWYPETVLSVLKHYLNSLKRFYLFIFRERGMEGERGRETSMCGCLSHAPYWGPDPQPRHVP